MSDDNGGATNDNVRRSRRIAAKEERPQLMDMVLADLEREAQTSKKKFDPNLHRKKIYRPGSRSKVRDEETGTLFDNGLQAVSIIGATSIDDDAKGISELCYLIKYENGQFELVHNKVAHKFCPMVGVWCRR